MSRATSVSLSLQARAQRPAMKALGLLPRGVLVALTRATRTNSDGESLAPEMAVIAVASRHLPGAALLNGDVAQSRTILDQTSASMAQTFPPFAIEEDLIIPSADGPIPATRYRVSESGARGLIVFLHGGGFVVGSRASHDSLVRALAVASGADVLSVDYRLAPEHQFPAAVDDSVAAFRYAVEQAPTWGLDPRSIVVAGDSAGGNLSAVVAQQVRDDVVQPCLQLLIYPVTDVSTKRGSIKEFSEGLFLTEADMEFFIDTYLPSRDDVDDPRASPLKGELAGLPPAYVVVAGFDPLRDEGLDYAAALEKAGVDVTVNRAGGMIHGFANMGLISPTARDVVAAMAAAAAAAMDAAS
ncbi:alpha/beta hydrolase [Gordonia malaquae]|uniref:Putative esterase n=1 Tax=Gordonia malaquae NBRC 108250 TaxID=1223542 RepID=M3VAN3_GORML|nr:alpha/beta hydrolase [Gordonia malaquae]GAC79003.1 putative esterase [Gordonia malaquae NBRC 108250]